MENSSSPDNRLTVWLRISRGDSLLKVERLRSKPGGIWKCPDAWEFHCLPCLRG
jgi:hypothetical protein